jgi:hypothetical protein
LALLEKIDPAAGRDVPRRLIWMLGLGAVALAWSLTTVAAYMPAVLGRFTDSRTLIGGILGAEGAFALALPLAVGPGSATASASRARSSPPPRSTASGSAAASSRTRGAGSTSASSSSSRSPPAS